MDLKLADIRCVSRYFTAAHLLIICDSNICQNMKFFGILRSPFAGKYITQFFIAIAAWTM